MVWHCLLRHSLASLCVPQDYENGDNEHYDHGRQCVPDNHGLSQQRQVCNDLNTLTHTHTRMHERMHARTCAHGYSYRHTVPRILTQTHVHLHTLPERVTRPDTRHSQTATTSSRTCRTRATSFYFFVNWQVLQNLLQHFSYIQSDILCDI